MPLRSGTAHRRCIMKMRCLLLKRNSRARHTESGMYAKRGWIRESDRKCGKLCVFGIPHPQRKGGAPVTRDASDLRFRGRPYTGLLRLAQGSAVNGSWNRAYTMVGRKRLIYIKAGDVWSPSPPLRGGWRGRRGGLGDHLFAHLRGDGLDDPSHRSPMRNPAVVGCKSLDLSR
jgi:hypothetical protein